MKYWEVVIADNYTYEDAESYIRNYQPSYCTRPEWEGVHFYNIYGHYCILFKDGRVEIDVDDVWSKEESDWMIVSITDEAVEQIEKYTKVSNDKTIIVNGLKFTYDSEIFEITDEILKTLENFPHEEDEDSFYMYYDNDMLVIY